ncbi:N-acetylmuramoyl-L-alanine amidase [Pontibacter sp. G13]|uniref:N-acetylmuramoyl-L-alanine amidase family protein n=1 Tax=Pontibacter sp. G13 TaxID=3074898 RepID=UPI00288B4368|nr:N-acetylmuramoyl-L-alanine amidase [Pontibacter sp. G13]WNJ19348.1 N-acetylmuramoyl-L-alanine amidase [Pontibacter sp. G13]
MRVLKFLLPCLLLVGWVSSGFWMPREIGSDGPIKTLVIDPGHGGKDPGAVGKDHYEKEIALQVSLKLRDLLAERNPGIKVVMTRDDDTFIPLNKRAEIAQDHSGDFFLSIHCNGATKSDRNGTETFVLGINKGQENYATIIRENEAILFEENYQDIYGGFDPSSPEGFIYFALLKNAFRMESTRMADKIQTKYREDLERVDRGVKQAPFVVLYLSGMPSVLTELGFITNPKEEAWMASEAGTDSLAESLYQSIVEYNLEFQASAATSE